MLIGTSSALWFKGSGGDSHSHFLRSSVVKTRLSLLQRFLSSNVNSLTTTVGFLLEVFIMLWIPSMVRIFTSAWS